MAAKSFPNFDLTSSLTFKFAKADVTAEPSSTLSMLKRFSFYPKSSVTSGSTARKGIIGLVV